MLAPAGALTRLKVSVCPVSLSVAEAVTVSRVDFTTLNVVCGRLSTGAMFRSVRSSSTSSDGRRGLVERAFAFRADRNKNDSGGRDDGLCCGTESPQGSR